jgi:hypothetical protein
VHNNGSFLIGGCDCPYTHNAVIELQSVPDQSANPYGTGVKTVRIGLSFVELVLRFLMSFSSFSFHTFSFLLPLVECTLL